MGLRTIVVLIFSAAVGLAFMTSLSPGLTLAVLPPLPIIAWLGWRLSRRVFDRSVAVQAGFADLSERVQENLGGIRTVQAQVQESREIERFRGVNDDYAERYLALTRTNSEIASLMPWLGAFCVVAIVGYGGSAVLEGTLTVGTLTAFLWYLNMVLWPVRQAGQMVTLWQQGASGTQRLFEILDAPAEIAEPAAPPPALPPVRGDLALSRLSYRFPDAAEPALADVDLHLAPGEFLAVMGPVGAGKTTLLRTLVRLLDPPPGSVRLDGVDVRDLPLADLRTRATLVPQDPFLFADLLGANLSYDDPARAEASIIDAAERGGLGETLERLPAGLATLVGERGVNLSGGQKQRATLTRGLIQDAGLLLLDDCFSSVDTETESRILTDLLRLRTGRTTILVTHRVSTASRADRILVLDAGRVAELGPHDALLAADGAYAALERMQRAAGAEATS
jgi:ATP-binding cassette subfamily B protein